MKCYVIWCCIPRVPQQIERIPILTINSSPEFETNEDRMKEMMTEVSRVLMIYINVDPMKLYVVSLFFLKKKVKCIESANIVTKKMCESRE